MCCPLPPRLLVSNCSEDSRHGPAALVVGGLPPVILCGCGWRAGGGRQGRAEQGCIIRHAIHTPYAIRSSPGDSGTFFMITYLAGRGGPKP
jgi:hypothetical protein